MLDLISKFICPFDLQLIIPPFKYEDEINSEQRGGNCLYNLNTQQDRAHPFFAVDDGIIGIIEEVRLFRFFILAKLLNVFWRSEETSFVNHVDDTDYALKCKTDQQILASFHAAIKEKSIGKGSTHHELDNEHDRYIWFLFH